MLVDWGGGLVDWTDVKTSFKHTREEWESKRAYVF